MQELRFVAVSEDGSYAVLAVPGRSARFVLPIDERLRAVALGQVSRLAQYEIEVESPLRPKEIQARIRAGETAEEIADAAGIPVERVRWFEGPVLAERAYIAQQAQTATVRRQGDSAGPGPHLGDIVAERVTRAGADPEEGQWDSRKRGDGSWQVQLTYSAAGRLHIAEWMFDPRRRHVMPEDDTAARLSLPESELPPEADSVPGEATVTPIASRLGAAAGMGGGMGVPPASVSRFRPERPSYPERSAPSAPERPAPERSVPERRPGDLGDRPAAGRPAAYAQPPAPPVTPTPVTPDPPSRGAAFHDSERIIPTPPSPPSDHRPAGAPWSESARRMPGAPVVEERAVDERAVEERAAENGAVEDPFFEDDGYQAGDYQFEDTAPSEAAPSEAAPPAAEPEAAAEPAVAATPAAADPEPAAAAPAAAEPAAPEAAAPAGAEEPPAAVSAAPAKPETGGETAPAKPAAAPAEKAAGKPAVAEVPAQAAAKTGSAKKEQEQPAKKTAAAKKEPEPVAAETAAKEKPAAEEQPARPRPAKKSARNRRSSVPSWDEIMLGSSRQHD